MGNDTSFRRTDKKKLSEFNLEEAKGWVIGSFRQIELRVDRIIGEFFSPKESRLFETVVLNSAVIDIGGKCKILSNIPHVEKSTIEKIRKLASIRNGFAHADTINHVTINVNTSGETHNTSIASITTKINVMNSAGKIISKDALEYLKEFHDLYNELRGIL